jgi:hypothetical protein
MIKMRRMRWAGHIPGIRKKRNAYWILDFGGKTKNKNKKAQ